MTEKNFLNCLFTESVLLVALGLGMLILPKVSSVSFGFMLCLAFITYGGYKCINAFLTRNFSIHYILDIIAGLILFLDGLILYFAPIFNVMIIFALAGVYLILESISSSALGFQSRNILYLWKTLFFVSVMQFIFGLIVIVILPSAALWLVGILIGVDFLIGGITKLNLYLSTKYVS